MKRFLIIQVLKSRVSKDNLKSGDHHEKIGCSAILGNGVRKICLKYHIFYNHKKMEKAPSIHCFSLEFSDFLTLDTLQGTICITGSHIATSLP